MIAVFVNCIAVILGSMVGILFSKKITEALSDTISIGAGCATFMMGIQMALSYNNIIYQVLSIILGGIAGQYLNIDGRILDIGKKLEKRFKPSENQPGDKNFAYAFLNSSVLFCVGAMAIVGSFEAAINHNYEIIFTKSILDGFMAIIFASMLGFGTIFSSLSILIYQGGLTLLFILLGPILKQNITADSASVNEIRAAGGLLIMLIGINLMGIKKIKTANYLPSVIFIVLFVLMDPIISKIQGLI